jgi:hypothetical protein
MYNLTMRHWTFVAVVTSALLVLSSGSALAQEFSHSKIGISTSIQDNQLDLMFPIWTNDRVVLTPSVGLIYVSDVVTDYAFGVMVRYNIGRSTAFPYVGARFGTLIRSYDGGGSTNDLFLGPAFGGEYFFSDHFSAGVEGQVNITLSDEGSTRFGNPGGTNINTGTSALVTFYF